jgi:hypothetical protein
MHNNGAKSGITSVIVISSAIIALVAGAGLGFAQKMRERAGDTIHIATQDRHGPKDVKIEVTTSDTDSTTTVILHTPRSYRARADSTSIVRFGENITIESDQMVEGDVVCIGGSVTVLGRVKGDVVSIGGSVELKGAGEVDGDAVSVGGTVRRPTGTRIGGENVGLRFIPSGLFGLWQPRAHLGLSIAFIVLKLVFLFFVGWLVVVLAESRMKGMGRYAEEHLWRSLFTGMAVLILFPAAFVLLLVTIVGIPLALLSPVALMLSLMVGYLTVAALLGLHVAKAGVSDRSSWVRGVATGLLLLEGIPLLGHLARTGGGPLHALGIVLLVFGYAAMFIASTIGLGSLVLSRFGQAKSIHATTPPSVATTEPSPA